MNEFRRSLCKVVKFWKLQPFWIGYEITVVWVFFVSTFTVNKYDTLRIFIDNDSTKLFFGWLNFTRSPWIINNIAYIYVLLFLPNTSAQHSYISQSVWCSPVSKYILFFIEQVRWKTYFGHDYFVLLNAQHNSCSPTIIVQIWACKMIGLYNCAVSDSVAVNKIGTRIWRTKNGWLNMLCNF